MENYPTIDYIKHNEGYRQFVYKCPSGDLTIGYGTNLEKRGISKKVAEIIVKDNISDIEESFRNNIDGYESFPYNAKKVMIDMAYNIGMSGFLKFKKLIKAIQEGNYKKASYEVLHNSNGSFNSYAIQTKSRAFSNSEILSRLS